MNEVRLTGHLAADPEIRAAGDKSVASFCIAVKRDYKNKDGEYDSDFIDCECWGSTAERAEKWLHKGTGVLVFGSLRTSKWIDKETGKNRKKQYVNADRFEFFGKKTAQEEKPAIEDYSSIEDNMPVAPLTSEEENDLPF